MTSHPSPPAAHCVNCSYPAPENFCPACGQKTHIETPTLLEFIHEYLHHYVALEGTLTRTLWMLLSRPGKLTTEYIVGRRQRYIKPLQLYLTISFIFFVLLGLFGSSLPIFFGAGDKDQPDVAEIVQKKVGANPGTGLQVSGAKGAGVAASMSAESAKDKTEIEKELLAGKEEIKRELAADAGMEDKPRGKIVSSDIAAVNAWGERLNHLQDEYKERPAATMEHLQKEAMHKLPYAVFGLMPIFAFLLWLLYYRRHLVYGVHLVFVLHIHAFAFLLFMLSLLPFVPDDALFCIFAVYFVAALRHLYGGRWIPQILRAFFLFMVYSVFVALAIAALVGSLV